MSFLGVGLGGFAKGLQAGASLGIGLNKAWREEEELNEKKTKKQEIDRATAAGMTDFQAAVSRGEEKPDNTDAIMRYTTAKLIPSYLKNQDLKGAQAATEWLRSDDTRRATKSWGEGMIAAQNGDVGSAIKKFTEAASTNGYGPKIKFDEPIQNEDGSWAVTGTNADGKKFAKVFKTPDDVIQYGATNLNPAAAYKSWEERAKADRERKADLETFKTKANVTAEINRETAAINRQGEGTEFERRFGITSQGQRDNAEFNANLETEKKLKQRALGLGDRVSTPADVATAKWLIDNKVAPNPEKAWEMVRTSRANPTATEAQVFNSALRANFGNDKKAREAVEAWRKFQADTERQRQPAARSVVPQRPSQMTPGDGSKPLAMAQPPGAGNKAQPFKATVQEHVEWFKSAAPAGAVIEINGQLFTK